MYDVCAFGELLIDFTPSGKSEKGNDLFECNPGGGVANVLAALAKLGKSTAFLGKVGEDNFGRLLEGVLKEINISSKGLRLAKDVNTTLAFVSLDKNGERSFTFYRKPGADMMMSEEDIDYEIIEASKVFHFGSVSMTAEPSRTATLAAADYAKQKGVTISYDPNLRLNLWNNEADAKTNILKGMGYADIVKISEEELVFLTGISSLEEGSKYLMEKYYLKVIFITLGSEGAFYRVGNSTGTIAGYKVNVVDTTGAGDSFLGGALYKIIECNKKLEELTDGDMDEVVRFANALGAIVTTRKGAMSIMPNMNEINQLVNK